jgi:tetratricopeptide (TPR) repeat protein
VTPDALAIIERLFKAFIFVPSIGLVAWWIFSAWLDRSIDSEEAWIGLGLLAIAFSVGVISIIAGGWGFIGIIAVVYVALLALAVYEYIYWRRRERDHYQSEVEKFKAAIERDPTNAAAHSFLGDACLRLGRFDEAEAALEIALQLDPESKKDRRLLKQARERRRQFGWRRLD